MTPRKGRGSRPSDSASATNTNYANYNLNNQYLQQYAGIVSQASDYESDNLYSFSDTQQQPAVPAPPPVRSNEELNIAVLRRHNPAITSILSLAPYVVIYSFNPESQQWEKNGVEGSMFVCQLVQGLYGEERYSVFVLNRRGLNNFDLHLTDENNVEVTDEFVILKSDDKSGSNGGDTPASHIYGLWIYSEPPPNSTAETRKLNAQVIRECAIHAGQSLLLARERVAAEQRNGPQQQPQQQVHASVPMGREISLKELFGQPSMQEDGFHNPRLAAPAEERVWGAGPSGQQVPVAQSLPQVQPGGGNVLGDLFRKAGLVHQGQ
ncbi:hypothetical protein BGW36DRAFT_290016 [Talaromyces proteolyticus]|uniref:Decapping enzyme Dcp1 n=1 Tax=Talaromyces proteolyticus TaxID=1131652 RepID=A0AAD4KZH1_9EURO|nr:uncharacterized protein BGW36DRAFT_290016 [Talaromyces proteolyticus]KAH8702407.1 hypothetical protein BGW36DRAFT_290016 [Talaromyces proteolyticus]